MLLLHVLLSVLTSCTVVPLLQHTVSWRIVEAWALHVRFCRWWLAAIRLVHTVCDTQHYLLLNIGIRHTLIYLLFKYLLIIYALLIYLLAYLFTRLCIYLPITMVTWSKAWSVFAHSNIRIMCSNPTRGMDIGARLFCICVVLCGLVTAWSPIQGVLPTVYRIKKLKKWPRSKRL
jgi:hypothetical protein